MASHPWEQDSSPDFNQIANDMLEQGLQCSPSQLQGCLAGLLAAGGAPEPEAALAVAAEVLGADFYGDLAGQVMDLYRLMGAQMRDEEFDFQPVLPDDEADIGERTEALAGWARGFLGGYARGVADPRPTGVDSLDEETSEILRDFAAIAEAGVGDDDEEGLEHSYTELVEYLRFAALNLFMESYQADGEDQPPALH